MNEENEILRTLKSIERKIEEIRNPPLWRSLVKGMLTGLGTVLGATLLLAILIALLRPFIDAPVIGQWINDVLQVVDRSPNQK